MDGVPYNLKPVGSYEELQNAFQTVFKNTIDVFYTRIAFFSD